MRSEKESCENIVLVVFISRIVFKRQVEASEGYSCTDFIRFLVDWLLLGLLDVVPCKWHEPGYILCSAIWFAFLFYFNSVCICLLSVLIVFGFGEVIECFLDHFSSWF